MVIKLNVVWEGPIENMRTDAYEIGRLAIDRIAGSDKHVEVDLFDLDLTGSMHPSYSHQREGDYDSVEGAEREVVVDPALTILDLPTPDQVKELVDRKECPCGVVHLKAGDIKSGDLDV